MTPQICSSSSQHLNWFALTAVLLGVVIVTLDISLTSTAIPAIALGLGLTAASTIWIINIYFLAVVAALLPLASLGEIYGHRHIFFIGLGIFALGSVVCGVSQSFAQLAAGRAVLGVGAAAVSATTPALIRSLYPPAKLSRGLGLYAMVVGIAFAIGPMAASAILFVANWPWLYWPNLPLAFLALGLAARALPATPRNHRSFDVLSAVLCAVMFACLLLAIGASAHWGAAVVLVALIMSALCGYGLWQREASHSAPIVAFDLLRIPLFALSAATSVCAFAIQGLVFVVLPFLFQYQLGYDQVASGFLITPWPVTLALMTLIAARLTDRIAPGILGCAGLLTIACGLALIATMPEGGGIGAIAWRLIVCGIGFGLFQSPNMTALMSSAPRTRSGSAGGILAASRLLGQSIGAAVVAWCLARWSVDGIQAALWCGTVCAIVGSAISVLRIAAFVRAAQAVPAMRTTE